MIGRNGLDENALDEKALDENWAHGCGNNTRRPNVCAGNDITILINFSKQLLGNKSINFYYFLHSAPRSCVANNGPLL